MREDVFVAEKPIDCCLRMLAIALPRRVLLGLLFFLRLPESFLGTFGLRALLALSSHGQIPFRLKRFQFGVKGGI